MQINLSHEYRNRKIRINAFASSNTKREFLAKLKKVFEEEHTDWWDEMTEKEKQDIKKGLSQADEGEFLDNEMVMKCFDKWH